MQRGMATLSVAQCKRLIAQGVAALPQVQQALLQGTIIIAGGTTNGYVAEELMGTQLDKAHYTAGVIQGRCCVTDSQKRLEPIVVRRGQHVSIPWQQALKDTKAGDIFIKGANALDSSGNIGILLGSRSGGTIGHALGTLAARGIELIAPVGLEKLVPSVVAAANFMGSDSLDYAQGMPCGIQVVTGATVVTEDKALSMLSGCQVQPVAKGGLASSKGSTTLVFAGSPPSFTQAKEIIRSMPAEKDIRATIRACPCDKPCDFPPQQ